MVNNTSAREQNRLTTSTGKPRNRASTACVSCRVRRTKCVVLPGETECQQCRKNDQACIVHDDDERKRPTSRAYMNSLTDRVDLLESMLRESGRTPPPANYPEPRHNGSNQSKDSSKKHKSSKDTHATNVDTSERRGSRTGSQSLPPESSGSSNKDDPTSFASNLQPDPPEQITTSRDSMPPPALSVCSASSSGSSSRASSRSLVCRLLSTSGHLSYDKSSGRTQYYGPTTNFHVYSDLTLPGTMPASWEQNRRTERALRDLSQTTHDYLMELYWKYYNSVMHIAHRDLFNRDREIGGNQYYSGFLHIVLLAMGFRFADRTRDDIRRISLADRESTLHREAKYLFEYELEKPGELPSVQALLVLGDLECGVGRDNTGWMIAGMACRLAFDIGLNLDCRQLGISEEDTQIRQMVLWACVVYDKYWALWLGRPTSIKGSDLSISQPTDRFSRLSTCLPAGQDHHFETQVYIALLDLMEHATKITESMQTRQAPGDPGAYFAMAALDQEVNAWYRHLPPQLRWTPANIREAPFSFFLLHQQFHSSLILLHRPFAQYNVSPTDGDSLNHFSQLSRTICFDNAIRVARIFQHHRQRFRTEQIFVTGIQHAGTAATALIAAIPLIFDPAERVVPMQHLRTLRDSLQDMATAYQPAEKMRNVLEHVLREEGWDLDNLPPMPVPSLGPDPRPVVPTRRNSDEDVQDLAMSDGQNAAKRLKQSGPSENSRVPEAQISNIGSQNNGLPEYPQVLSPQIWTQCSPSRIIPNQDRHRSESLSKTVMSGHAKHGFGLDWINNGSVVPFEAPLLARTTVAALRPDPMSWMDSIPSLPSLDGDGDTGVADLMDFVITPRDKEHTTTDQLVDSMLNDQPFTTGSEDDLIVVDGKGRQDNGFISAPENDMWGELLRHTNNV